MKSVIELILPVMAALFVAAVHPLFAEDPDPVGLRRNTDKASDGYTLFCPLFSTTTYLIDMKGRVVHSWESDYPPGQSVYLLENGHLLRTANPGHEKATAFHGGGAGGIVQEFAWNNELLWQFEYCDEKHQLHHDICRLPNGNTLMLAWEKKSPREAYDAGRNKDRLGEEGLWPDSIIEVAAKGKSGGTIVWEWHAWDHLIQEIDRKRNNYGKVADHPERININPLDWESGLSHDEEAKLRALGYLSGPKRNKERGESPDWMHTNAIDYNAELDQIVISVLGFNEIWIIDHSTTTEEAAGHEGGRYGRGGDLLYRWGNPMAYGRGSPEDQQLFAQHDAHWIAGGQSGAGRILVFNNGRGRPERSYSSVEEIETPVDEKGCYSCGKDTAFGPDESAWTYSAKNPLEFYSSHISGAQRLKNGDTLICSGEKGRLFEVTAEGETVWEYINPVKGGPHGPPPGAMGKEMPGMRPPPDGMDGGIPTRQNATHDDEGDGNPMRRRPPPGGGRRNGPPGMGGPPHQGGESENCVFRAYRYSSDYPGLEGKKLTPGKTIEALQNTKTKVDNK